jgi:hypothetical protein
MQQEGDNAFLFFVLSKMIATRYDDFSYEHRQGQIDCVS